MVSTVEEREYLLLTRLESGLVRRRGRSTSALSKVDVADLQDFGGKTPPPQALVLQHE
jgi:hypothetical protein